MTRPGHRAARRPIACQRGQDTVEWAAVLIVVAAVLAAVVAIAPLVLSTLSHDVPCVIEQIFGDRCASAPAYPVSVSTETAGYNGRVAIVDGSHSYTVTLTKLSNGTSTITIVNNGKLGVSANAGASVELGPLGGASADASAGGGGYGDKTTTWTYPSWSQGQKSFQSISHGSGLGLAAHDALNSVTGQIPGGGLVTGLFDHITGASGAPGPGSLPKKYVSSTAVGGGAQGSASANAGANLGPLNIAGVNASLNAKAGIEHITSGPLKGDNQLVAGLTGNATGNLVSGLFGSGQANAAGNVNGQVVVTFSPSGQPEALQVAASGDGVWDVAPPSNLTGKSPSESGGSGGQSGSGGKSGSGENGAPEEPVLKVDTRSSGGSGVGTSFVGTLNLSTDPQATRDLEAMLQGDPAKIDALIGDMNSSGTESVQTYTISRSNSTYGGSASVGVGFGAGVNDGSSSATYNPPKTREDGGTWHNGSS